MPADLINVVVQCFCKLRKMPNIDIDAKAVQSSSAPTSPSSQGDRATDKLDFTDSCNEVETDNGAHEGSPFGENSILRLMFAQNAELEALWQEGSEVPRFVSFADVIQCCPSSVATTLFRKVMPQIVSTGGSNIYKKSSLAFPIVDD